MGRTSRARHRSANSGAGRRVRTASSHFISSGRRPSSGCCCACSSTQCWKTRDFLWNDRRLRCEAMPMAFIIVRCHVRPGLVILSSSHKVFSYSTLLTTLNSTLNSPVWCQEEDAELSDRHRKCRCVHGTSRPRPTGIASAGVSMATSRPMLIHLLAHCTARYRAAQHEQTRAANTFCTKAANTSSKHKTATPFP